MLPGAYSRLYMDCILYQTGSCGVQLLHLKTRSPPDAALYYEYNIEGTQSRNKVLQQQKHSLVRAGYR